MKMKIDCDECKKEIGTKEEIMEDMVEAHKVERNKTVEILCEECYHEQPLGSLEEDYNAETYDFIQCSNCLFSKTGLNRCEVCNTEFVCRSQHGEDCNCYLFTAETKISKTCPNCEKYGRDATTDYICDFCAQCKRCCETSYGCYDVAICNDCDGSFIGKDIDGCCGSCDNCCECGDY